MFAYTVFETPNNKYLFDGSSCYLFNIESPIYENHYELFKALEEQEPKVPLYLRDEFEELKSAVQSQVIKPISSEPYHLWFDKQDYLENLRGKIHHLVIGITENCNMRCRYCVYGGHYIYERTHKNIKMDFSTIKRCIDYFYDFPTVENQRIINFYGGEPFLAFEDIKRAVEYVSDKGEEPLYYITTNGTLLSYDIIKWIIDNKNVHLFISLAGVPEMHDDLRVFIDETPTYSEIKKNILKIKENDYETFSERIHFIFNIFDERQIPLLQRFWESDMLFEGCKNLPEVTFIDCGMDDGSIKRLREENLKKYCSSDDPLRLYIDYLKNGEYSNIVVQYYTSKFLNIHRRALANTHNYVSGACEPFVHKLFVDIYGRVHICENFVTEKCFGTIWEELDKDKVKDFLHQYETIRNKTCRGCWASKLCSLCYKDIIGKNGCEDYSMAEQMCDAERQTIMENLREYCIVREENETLLDYLVNERCR